MHRIRGSLCDKHANVISTKVKKEFFVFCKILNWKAIKLSFIHVHILESWWGMFQHLLQRWNCSGKAFGVCFSKNKQNKQTNNKQTKKQAIFIELCSKFMHGWIKKHERKKTQEWAMLASFHAHLERHRRNLISHNSSSVMHKH